MTPSIEDQDRTDPAPQERSGAYGARNAGLRQRASSKRRPRFASTADLDAYLDTVAGLSKTGLRGLWRKERVGEPPKALTKDLMARALSYWAQEEVFGGLTAQEEKQLAAIARGASDPTRRLKPGSIIVREHAGEMHEVMVSSNGYVWRGRLFASLSALALAITGTNWNGYRFFGLQSRREGAKNSGKSSKRDRGARGSRGARKEDLSRLGDNLDVGTAAVAVSDFGPNNMPLGINAALADAAASYKRTRADPAVDASSSASEALAKSGAYEGPIPDFEVRFSSSDIVAKTLSHVTRVDPEHSLLVGERR